MQHFFNSFTPSTTAPTVQTASDLLSQTRCRGVALHRFAVDFDPADVHIAAVAVAAPWNQIRETDFINFPQVSGFEQIPACPALVRTHLNPANAADRESIAMVVGIGPI